MTRPPIALTLGLLVLAQVGARLTAHAIPSFTRKYETSCTTCHIAPPKLNAFGRAFKNLGYRMSANDEDLVKQKPISLGAPAWKKVWPNAIWPSSIPGGEFMGFGLSTNFRVNPSQKVTNSFDGIDEIALLLGGTLGESFSFFGALGLFEEGEPGEIGRLFIQYNNPHRYLNVTVGQFEPRASPFSNHLRMTRQTSYLFSVFPSVAADNFFGFSPNQRGIEIWGGKEGVAHEGGWLWSFGVVNGDFGESAKVLEKSSVSDLIRELQRAREEQGSRFDVNSGKDFYLQSSYKIGGLGVFGSGSEKALEQTTNWRDNSLTVGGYFYRGTTGAFIERNGRRDFLNSANQFYRTGFSLDAWLHDLNLFGAWQRNHDRLDDGRIFDVDIGTVELDYVLPWPWVQPAVRFEHVRPDFGDDFSRWSFSLSLILRANAVLTLDAVLKGSPAPNLPLFDDEFRVGFRLYF